MAKLTDEQIIDLAADLTMYLAYMDDDPFEWWEFQEKADGAVFVSDEDRKKIEFLAESVAYRVSDAVHDMVKEAYVAG